MAVAEIASERQEQAKSYASAIEVERLSKFYRIPREKKTTVYENLIGLLKGSYMSYDEFWALKDVSFSVSRGETLGIIGPNGCGKSTLLKIMAGVLFADTGKVAINGKIAPFLELGVGFQPELTAKENVYLYGAIMGLTRKEVAHRYEEIMEFSELKRFENMRLKNFSSGMYVRLAFSTAIQTDPDIFLIDEVLSVGDELFQRKCSEKIDEIRRKGKTIILVSHSLPTIQRLCERSVLLHKGHLEMIGRTETVIGKYLEIINTGNTT